MKKNNISAGIIYGLALVLVAVIYFVYAYLPLREKTEALDQQHQADTLQIQLYESYIAQQDSIVAKIEELQKKLDTANSSASLKGVKVVDDIGEGLSRYEVILESIEMRDEAIVTPSKNSHDGKPLYSVPITMSFFSTMEQLQSLLRYFETTSAAAYYITGITLTVAENGLFNMSLAMDAYYYSPQEDIVKTAPIPEKDNPESSENTESSGSSVSSENDVSSEPLADGTASTATDGTTTESQVPTP